MRKEEECNPSERYLFSQEYFSDSAIKIWQEQCIQRCRDREKGEAYAKFINWKRQENEIAVFTLYAYADFNLPKWFDCIFQLENPRNHLKMKYELSQSIFEAWYPFNYVGHGHKHLCIFSFEDYIPGIFSLLHKIEGQFSSVAQDHPYLGYCNSEDFDAIIERREYVINLRNKYGKKWIDYDIED